MKPATVLADVFIDMGLMSAKVKESLDDIHINDEDYRPVPAEKAFTDRLLSEPNLWLDHVVDAMGLESNDFCTSLQARLSVMHDEHRPDYFAEAQRQLGEAIYNEVIKYGESQGE